MDTNNLPRTREPLVVTACLACGWVHGYPWRCPRGATQSADPTIGKAVARAPIFRSDPLFVADEFYPFEFAREVRDLVPNTFVENTGNASAPPPSPEWWEKAWNTLAGFGQWVWNGAVAVGTFFYNVGVWLVDIAVGVIIGLATGNWTYFQENVIGPLKRALEALIKFIIDLVKAAIDFIIKPIRDVISGLKDAAGRFLLGFFNQIRATHGSGTGHSGTHNTNAMAAWVAANQATPMGVFVISASVIFLAALVAGALLESMPIIGGALTLIFVAVFAIMFAVSFPKPLLDAGANVPHTLEGIRGFEEQVATTLGDGRYLLAAILGGLGWQAGAILAAASDANAGLSVINGLRRAELSLLLMGFILAGAIQEPHVCAAKWVGVSLAIFAELILVKTLFTAVSRLHGIGAKIAVGAILLTFLAMNTIAVTGALGDISLNCME